MYFVNLQGEETLGKIPEQPLGDVPRDDPEGDTSIGKPIGQNETPPYTELAQCLANDFLRRYMGTSSLCDLTYQFLTLPVGS